MELSDFASKYWNKPDSKILFANYAKQRNLGLIPDALATQFKNHLACCSAAQPSAEDTLADKSLAGSSFTIANAHFSSPNRPTLAGNQIILRVAPLGMILSKVDMAGKESRLQKQLDLFMDVTEDDLARSEAERRLRTAFRKGVFSDFIFDWPDQLEPFTPFALEAVLKRESGAGLAETRSKQPRFISYLIDGAGGENANLSELKGDLNSTRGYGLADFARDVFGLDHLADNRYGKPNVLGFVAFQASELDIHRCARPTVFDDTSPLRFRGACSKDTPDTNKWGHTADLFKLHRNHDAGIDESIVGCPEAVFDNPILLNERRVLVGYLGPLEVAREDHNDLNSSTKPAQYAKMQQLHEAFLQKCLAGMSQTDVHAAIFEGN